MRASVKDQGVDTRAAVVHMIRDRSLFHQVRKEDDDGGGVIGSPFGFFL